ncbi:TolC family protein [Pseudomonas vanderleydeniana]|uniref:TolC family protein n=1 Tax=Pseudomonas vanderleydeniana TaxID=2745495 RepID=A0A9E6TQ80_9PSED|nr:TolC family protein [Pseudomonas vanderleydeniana]QXI26609.1 TolC family protein [Pseudomonas vanderleydeniana]
MTTIKPLIRSQTGRALCLLSLALWGLAGCSATPVPPLTASLPDVWQNAPAPVRTPQPALQQWWHAFNDPALDALVEQALRNNLEVAAAVQRLRATRLLSQHSSSAYLPSLGINTRDAISPDTSTSYFLVGFDAQWELPLFGMREGVDRLAQGNLAWQESELRTVQVSLVAEVCRNWIELRAAQQGLASLGAIRDTQREKLELLLVRERLKLASASQVSAARGALDQAEMALTRPRQQINRKVRQLAVLLARSQPDPAWLQPGPVPQLGAWQLGNVPADLLRTRPEISAAEAQVIIAAGNLGISRADVYPHISLGSSLQWSLNVASNRRHARSGNSIFSFGPGINLPLFDWGQRIASAQARDHELQAALLAYRQSVLEGGAEVETALGDLEQLRLREQSSRQSQAAAEAHLEARQQQLRLGLLSRLELDGARVAGLRAQQQVDSASAERGIAYVALYKALGGAALPVVAATEVE